MNRRKLTHEGILAALVAQGADLKQLIGLAEKRSEIGRRKRLKRATGAKAKARTRERIAAASRKRNRR